MKSRYICALAAIAACIAAAVLAFHRSPSPAKPSAPAPTIPEHQAFGSVTSNNRPLPLSFMANSAFPWLERPPGALAHRREERAGLAWILRQFGASETTLDRVAHGDLSELMSELKRQASKGDAIAINTLGWLARRCDLLRPPEIIDQYDAGQKLQARTLPQSEAVWLISLIDEDEAREHALSSACSSQINQDGIGAMVKARAVQGDPGSQWLLSESADNVYDLRRLLREAAAGGFPEAQYALALQLVDNPDPQWHLPGDPSPIDLLREAASELPDARATLAICEFSGCEGTTPDVTAAVQDARTAAQSGQPSAMLSLSATLPVGALDPGEGAA